MRAGVDIKLRKGKKSLPGEEVAREVSEAVGEVLEPIDDVIRGRNRVKPTRLLKQEAPVCYPSKGLSRMLGLRNLLFPVYNLPFALGIGAIYWLITWQFYSVVERHDISAGKIDAVGMHAGYADTFAYFPLYLLQACLVSIPLAVMLVGLLAGLIWYVDAIEQPRWRHWLTKIIVGGAHFAAHVTTMFALGFFFVMLNNWTSPYIEREINTIWQQSNSTPTATGRAVKEILEPLSSSRAGQRQAFDDKSGAPGQLRRAAPPVPAQPDAKAVAATGGDPLVTKNVRQVVGFVLYPLQAIVIGGIVGGFVFGLYWVITSVALRMHAAEAFAALRIKDYKNFMRLRFDRDTLTIYPIGIDKIPRRRFWQGADKAAPPTSHAPRFTASGHIDVRLIEKPIVISARG